MVSAALHALSDYVNPFLPVGAGLLSAANFFVSFVLIAVLFATIYKVLPDRPLAWRDVLIGAVGTTGLFEVGKWLIALYIGSSAIASSYGAAGALIVVLLWIYYTAQIFLLGRRVHKGLRQPAWLEDERTGAARPRGDRATRAYRVKRFDSGAWGADGRRCRFVSRKSDDLRPSNRNRRRSRGPVTRQTTSPTSSATSSEPSWPSATPTGRP